MNKEQLYEKINFYVKECELQLVFDFANELHFNLQSRWEIADKLLYSSEAKAVYDHVLGPKATKLCQKRMRVLELQKHLMIFKFMVHRLYAKYAGYEY